MNKSVLIISGSPKKNGNTALLVEWLAEGARSSGYDVDIVNAASIDTEVTGCQSCRACQNREEYGCVFKDGVSSALDKMVNADIIVMATPLYFFSASTQIKQVLDRMFSLYKWDNALGTMKTALKGKTLAVIASAFEAEGFDALEKPFIMTAEYSCMKYTSLIVPNAGESGDIKKLPGIRDKAFQFGKTIS